MTLPFRPRRGLEPPSGPARSEFDELFLAHFGALCQFSYRIVGSRAVAEDIVQDLFLSLWRRRETMDLQNPLPYLYTAVRNRSISHGRRQRWRLQWLTTRAREEESAPTADDAELGELAVALERALAALPERRRLIFTLHREQHLTYAEIARTLDISIKTVETQMGRALRTLRERLAPFLGLLFALASTLAGSPPG